MKFLTAASFLCIALIGHTQGGSLRGLSVVVPHQEYGVPLPSSQIPSQEIKAPIDDKKPCNELQKQEEPTTSKPFVGSLPLIDSAANFGSPSFLPAAPLVQPIAQPIAQPIVTPIFQQTSVVPLGIAQPINSDSVQITSELSNGLVPGLPQLPNLGGIGNFPTSIVTQIVSAITSGLPSLIGVSNSQSASVIPQPVAQPILIPQQVSNTYLPPKPELPVLPQVTLQQPILAQPALPLLPPGLPALPAAPIVPLEEPIKSEAQLSNTYLTPKPEVPLSQPIQEVIPVEQPIKKQPELPLLPPGLPELPAAPIVPIVPLEQPVKSEAQLSNTYLPPKPEVPLSQPIPEVISVEQPIQKQPEFPLLPPGLPELPAAPIVPVVPLAIEKPTKTEELPKPQESSSGILIPFVISQSGGAQPELTFLQPSFATVPAAPNVPLNIQQPSSAVVLEEQKPTEAIELPKLPEAPVTPAPPKAAEESKEGYIINKPDVAAQLENEKLNQIVPAQQQIPIAPGFISSQILDFSQASHTQPPQGIPVHPPVPVQQVFVQDVELTQPPRQELAPAQPIQSGGLHHHGYSYEAPQLQFLLPNQY